MKISPNGLTFPLAIHILAYLRPRCHVTREQPRSRPAYAVAALVVVGLGLLSRSDAAGLPWAVAKYAGDGLWGLVVFLGLGLLLPRAPTDRAAVLAAAFAVGVEAAQLVHPAWLDAVRRTLPGGLVLGTPASVFAWADILAYLVGIGAGGVAERAVRRSVEDRTTGS